MFRGVEQMNMFRVMAKEIYLPYQKSAMLLRCCGQYLVV
jgi:hypothetical protein